MIGIVPIFYHIPITPELIKCVQAGRFSTEPTIVQKCIPPVPDQDAYYKEGLFPLANWRIVIQCFEAFKAFIVSLAQCPQLSAINLSCEPGHMICFTCNEQHGSNLFHIHDFIKTHSLLILLNPNSSKILVNFSPMYIFKVSSTEIGCRVAVCNHGIKQPLTETNRSRSDHLAITCSGICWFFTYTPVPASFPPEFRISNGSIPCLSG